MQRKLNENKVNHWENLLERIAKLRVLVIGDLMLDRYVFGDAHRISPEAPVPVVDIEREKETLGAAGNVALNLRSIGAGVEVLGIFGEDIPGERLKHLLSAHGIRFDPRCQQKNVRTILKTRVIVRGQQLCRLDVEDLPEKYDLERAMGGEEWLARVRDWDAIIFSDYAKGVMTQGIADRVIGVARSRGIITAADPKPKSGVQFRGIDLLKPNKSEALEMAGVGIHGRFSTTEICRAIFTRQRPKYLVITLGQEGMLVAEGGEIVGQIASDAREIFDVSGAGDTAIAFLTVALAARESIIGAAKLANLASGVVVGKIGTATVTANEILGAMRL